MRMELVNRSRKGWVDALRGVAILLVIYGHNITNMPEFYIFTSPIKMPLFFAISGYLFSSNKEWPLFLNTLLRKLVIPWIALGIVYPIVLIPFNGIHFSLHYFIQMLLGEVLWFMPCLIIAEIIHYIIIRYCKKNVLILLVSFICFIIGIFLHHKGLLNFAMINCALSVQPFFLIGRLFRKYESKIKIINWRLVVLLAIIYLGLGFTSMKIYPGQSLDVHMVSYYNIPFCLVHIFLGCFLLFVAACKMNISSNLMSFIGQNTLILYMWHGMAIVFLVKGLQLVGWIMPINWWTALIKLVWALIVCGIVAVLINRFLPWAVGKSER